MRLFIACELSKEAVHVVKGVQEKILGAKVSKVREFHMTFKFLGEVSPKVIDVIKVRLAKVAFKSFSASLGGIGFFPSEAAPRVVWVGLEPKAVICELQKQIDDALFGLFAKEKSFEPHVTLARVKGVEDYAQFSKISQAVLNPAPFIVTEFKLIQSKLSREGPTYHEVAVFPGEK